MSPRLRLMGPREIACRGRQGLAAWCERAGAALAAGRKSGAERTGRDDADDGAPSPFFAGPRDDRTVSFVRERFPEAAAEARAAALRLARGRFDLLGYRDLDFGMPIDWHLDPVSGTRAPRLHWTRIDPADLATCGDCKVIWELGRHQWMAALGRAWRLTGDARHAELAGAMLADWIRANPCGIGIHWTSGLEMALRIVAWCWAMDLLRDAPVSFPRGAARAAVRLQARRIERYLSRYSAPNTHLTGEALGLLYAGTFFPGLREAARWRALGRSILIDRIGRHVLPDGVYFEQSTCYQRYTVEIYLHFMVLAQRAGITLPASVAERVQRAVDFLVAVVRPDGSVPEIGDADGGWLLPLVRRSPFDVRGVLSTAAVLFGRADYARAAGGLAEETAWILGERRARWFDSLSPSPPEAPASRVFPHGGYALMRSGWEEGADRLLFDVGPLGGPGGAAHGHADLLAIHCDVAGEPFIIDAGTCRYAADRAWRDHFRGTPAHSTLTVDGESQAKPRGAFGWRGAPRPRLRRFAATERYDFADADHAGYRRLAGGVVHRRRVLFLKPRCFVIVDDVEGRGSHRVETRFLLGPPGVDEIDDGWVRVRGAAGTLLVRAFTSSPARRALARGGDPPGGWRAPDYGIRVPATALVYSIRGRPPIRIVTLLVPVRDAAQPPPETRALTAEGDPRPIGVTIGAEQIVFDERTVTVRAADGSCWKVA